MLGCNSYHCQLNSFSPAWYNDFSFNLRQLTIIEAKNVSENHSINYIISAISVKITVSERRFHAELNLFSSIFLSLLQHFWSVYLFHYISPYICVCCCRQAMSAGGIICNKKSVTLFEKFLGSVICVKWPPVKAWNEYKIKQNKFIKECSRRIIGRKKVNEVVNRCIDWFIYKFVYTRFYIIKWVFVSSFCYFTSLLFCHDIHHLFHRKHLLIQRL